MRCFISCNVRSMVTSAGRALPLTSLRLEPERTQPQICNHMSDEVTPLVRPHSVIADKIKQMCLVFSEDKNLGLTQVPPKTIKYINCFNTLAPTKMHFLRSHQHVEIRTYKQTQWHVVCITYVCLTEYSLLVALPLVPIKSGKVTVLFLTVLVCCLQ